MKLPPGHVPGLGVRKATAYGGFGEKLLRQWGWEKGQGCGKNKQGISEAVQVKKKDDNNGVSLLWRRILVASFKTHAFMSWCYAAASFAVAFF